MEQIHAPQRQAVAQMRHLFNRAAFGGTPAELNAAARMPLRRVVKKLIDDSQKVEPLQVVAREEYDSKKQLKGLLRNGMLDRDALRTRIRENAELVRDLNVQWLDRMVAAKGALREKMALFWHGHFAVRAQGRNALVMQDYGNVIRQHALGSFGDLLMAVSKTPAMLQFLNNQQNRKNAPNENFARELMELFTLGRGSSAGANYTEHDIKEAARAFTGWQFTLEGQFVFRERVHDDGPKTIFGKTGLFKGEDVIGMLLERRETARFVVDKLYRFFVNETPDPARVNDLAEQFYRSGYQIADLMETIFSASWFYDKANLGAQIKSPVELLAGMRHTLGVSFDSPQPQVFVQRTLGQILFYPPNVAGWPGGRNWIDSSSLLFRMKLPDYVLRAAEVNVRSKDEADVNATLLARKGANQFATKVDWAGFEKPFARVAEADLPDALATYLLPLPLRPEQRNLLLKQLKPGQDTSETIKTLTAAIMALPEYQLS
ncbi:DUF1800 domain-containing protein [Rudanella lutea]|uniref:DUF1800 domain-containing protein n=1 Tax=Rudanella lutea TaxID=451374 RepID=UPI000360A34F|nr:DUF1800 domain-containing protein [Rudanella lutea]